MRRLLLFFGIVLGWTTMTYGQCNLSPVTLPISEGFENFTGPITATAGTDTVFDCNTGHSWSYYRGGTNGQLSFTQTSNTGSQSAVLACVSSGTYDTNYVTLTVNMSNITASAASDVFLSFAYRESGDEVHGPDRVWVRGSNTDSWIEILDWSSTASSSWQNFQIKIDSVVSANSQTFSASTQVRWGQYDNFTWGSDGFAFDDVMIQEVNCSAPSGFTASNITSSSIDLSWTNGGSTNTQIALDTAGFSLTSANYINLTSGTSYTASGLSPATEYEVYIRDSCGAGDFSLWVGPISFKTLCVPYTATYTTDFDSDVDGQVAACWEQYNNYNTSAYARVEQLPSWNSTQPYSGANVLEIYSYFGFSAGDTLMAISPEFSDLTASDKQIRFYAAASDASNELYIGTTSDQSGTAAITLIDTISFATTNTWQEVIVALDANNGYNGTDDHVVLMHSLGGTFDDIYIDDFNYELIPPCPKITGFNFTGVGPSSASFSFSTSGDSIDVEWGPVGFTQGTGCLATLGSTSGSASINNSTASNCAVLAPNTSYELYIRNNCSSSGNGNSVWSGPYVFRTACAAQVAPYYQNFDTWRPTPFGSTFNPGDSIGPCWDRSPEIQAYMWLVDDNGTGSSNTGPDPSIVQGNYVYTEASTGSTGDLAYFISPFVDISGLNNPFMSFDVHAVGNNIDTLFVEYWTGNAWANLITLGGTQQVNQTDPFIEIADTIPPLASGNETQIRFVAQRGTSFGGDWAIDNFGVYEAPSCLAPSNLAVDTTTSSSATVIWTAGGATTHHVEWGAPGFTPGTGAGIDSATVLTDTFYTITGLNAATGYDVYVRDSCSGSAGTSMWAGPLVFATACPTVFNTPYSTDLEILTVGAFIDYENCWTADKVTDPNWEAEDATGSNENSFNTGPWYDNTTFGTPGGKYWYLETSGGSQGDEGTLTSQLFDLSGLTQPSLYFYYHMYGADMGSLHVDIEHQGTWYNDYWVKNGQQDTAGNDAWNQAELNMASFVGDTVRVRFRGAKGTGLQSDMAIDDISFAAASSCAIPVNIQANNVTSNSASISWGSYNTNFNVLWGPTGFYQGTGTAGNTIANTNQPVSLSGLSPNTEYDVYVEDPCDPGNYIGPFTFKTPCLSSLAGGTYTIGAAASNDFQTIDSAIAVMTGCGISGPVVFNVQPGAYSVSQLLTPIPGASATNTITFNGASGADTISGTGTGVFTFDGGRHITLNGLTINALNNRAVWLYNDADSNAITNCTINSDTTGTSSNGGNGIIISNSATSIFSNGADVDHLNISNNTIKGGYAGIMIRGGSTSDRADGIAISGNAVSDIYFYGIYTYYTDGMVVDNNRVEGFRSTGGYGLYAFYPDNFSFLENEIYEAGTYGIYISQGNGLSAPSANSEVVNNMIETKANGDGMYLSGTDYTNIYHNTSVGEYGIRVFSHNSLDIRNNIFVGTTNYAGYFSNAFTAGTDSLDYNLYYAPSNNTIYSSGAYTDLAAWQNAQSDFGANSLEGDPIFSGPKDLHILGTLPNDAGDNSVNITVDIDGDTRPQAPSTTVDIGADEFTPLQDDAELLEIIAAGGCGDSTTTVGVVFRNNGLNAISSMPVSATISGGVSATLNATYTGNLASLGVDTMLVGGYNTYAGANGVNVAASLNLAADQDNSNDSLSAGPFDYLPFEAVGFDTTECLSADSAFIRGLSIPGVEYGWFATNNTATDTVPLATGDTFAVPLPLAQSTYFLSYLQGVQGNLTTTFAGGNGQDGNAFDIMPSENLSITALDVNLDGSGAQTVEVYYKTGTYVGSLTSGSMSAWTLHEAVSVTGMGAGVATHVPFTNPLPVNKNTVYGMIVVVTSAGDVDYTNGTSTGAVLAQNSELTIYQGHGLQWPLGSNDFDPRNWNGVIYYGAPGCSDIRTPVNINLAADTAEASFTTTGTQPTFNFDASASVNADSYAWDFGDGNTATGVTASHTYASNGSFTVTLTVYDSTGCFSVAEDSTVVNLNVGIEENELEQSLHIFPNPASDVINLRFNQVGSGDATIRLMDMQGREIYREQYSVNGSVNETAIKVSELATGTYILEVESAGLKARKPVSIK